MGRDSMGESGTFAHDPEGMRMMSGLKRATRVAASAAAMAVVGGCATATLPPPFDGFYTGTGEDGFEIKLIGRPTHFEYDDQFAIEPGTGSRFWLVPKTTNMQGLTGGQRIELRRIDDAATTPAMPVLCAPRLMIDGREHTAVFRLKPTAPKALVMYFDHVKPAQSVKDRCDRFAVHGGIIHAFSRK